MTDPDALRRLQAEKEALPPGDDLAMRAVMQGWITARQLEEARADLRRRVGLGKAGRTLQKILVERGRLQPPTLEPFEERKALFGNLFE
jgi:hypothetical protein